MEKRKLKIVTEELREAARVMGRIGGKTRAARLSARRRAEISAYAAKVRWDQYRLDKSFPGEEEE